MDSHSVLFFQHEFIKDRQYLFAIEVHLPQRIAEAHFIAAGVQPFVQQRTGDVDIAPKIVRRMTAQKETVEDSRLSLRCERIEIVPANHTCNKSSKSVSYY